ncbi:MAG: hypothetical protein DWQ31_21315 [Planctomycetota bacterium]|nr:MAG: hypothetical protein DWQ31_21315 [Planctomycetota bacterium]REJ93645.1 MAG: hypothetical protein DWQ35_09850 [Planctomycetota bacterium]REK25694.1 MAG: hypothetical protein DWQ42_10590 [Planctomycetota bacterium]REK46560.1 MAG: hypothetical protein DWQ46_06715 [Planctomycetota bacterium]
MGQRKLVPWEPLVVATIFSKEIAGWQIAGSYVDLYQLALGLVGLIVMPNLRVIRIVTVIAVGMAGLSFGLLTAQGYSHEVLLRQLLPAYVIYMGIGSLLMRCRPSRLLRQYLGFSVAAALLGLIQVATSAAGINLLVKQAGELDSVALEPSHFAVIVAPAFGILLAHTRITLLGRDTWKLGILLASLLLTKSLTAMALILVCGALASKKKLGMLAMIIVGVALPYVFILTPELQSERVQERVEAFDVFLGNSPSYEATNLTVKSLATNLDVAKYTLGRRRWFGNGFGGHQFAYEEHFAGTPFTFEKWYGINSLSAHSLSIRTLSEFGIPGAILLVWFLVKCLRRSGAPAPYGDIWALSFIYFVARSFKLGSLVDYGCPFFFIAPFAVRATALAARRRLAAAEALHNDTSLAPSPA